MHYSPTELSGLMEKVATLAENHKGDEGKIEAVVFSPKRDEQGGVIGIKDAIKFSLLNGFPGVAVQFREYDENQMTNVKDQDVLRIRPGSEKVQIIFPAATE